MIGRSRGGWVLVIISKGMGLSYETNSQLTRWKWERSRNPNKPGEEAGDWITYYFVFSIYTSRGRAITPGSSVRWWGWRPDVTVGGSRCYGHREGRWRLDFLVVLDAIRYPVCTRILAWSFDDVEALYMIFHWSEIDLVRMILDSLLDQTFDIMHQGALRGLARLAFLP